MGPPEVIARVVTPRGELVLRRHFGPDGEHFEIISNGVFLMDTRDGRSERLLAQAALAALERPERPRSVLVGGLGVGFTLEAVLADSRVEAVTVVEVEQPIVDWYAGSYGGSHGGSYGGKALSDARVRLVVADVAEVLREETGRYDVICLDVDNGPGWTVTDDNTRLYTAAVTQLIRDRLNDGGALAVWSAHASPPYESVLREVFDEVAVHTVDVARGEPDVVYVSRSSQQVRRGAGTG